MPSGQCDTLFGGQEVLTTHPWTIFKSVPVKLSSEGTLVDLKLTFANALISVIITDG